VLALDAALLAWALGGAAALAREPRALALLAIWGASGFVLALRRPVRVQDLAESQRDIVPMLVLLVVPLFTPALGAYVARRGWAVLPQANAVSWAGIALVAAGHWLRIAAMVRLGPRFSPLVAVQRDHVLERSGPYARVRHPGYLGALLACLGGALAFGSAAALPLVAIMLAAQLARVRREERMLENRFGEEWRAYAARTGALLPTLGRGR
jgi:protein-S-isoprenylcysteine O-methyltransferase Ste14